MTAASFMAFGTDPRPKFFSAIHSAMKFQVSMIIGLLPLGWHSTKAEFAETRDGAQPRGNWRKNRIRLSRDCIACRVEALIAFYSVEIIFSFFSLLFFSLMLSRGHLLIVQVIARSPSDKKCIYIHSLWLTRSRWCS